MPKNTTKILFFLEGPNVPASRFRVLQYQKNLQRSPQVNYKFLYTWPDKYLWAPNWLKMGLLRRLLLALMLCLVMLQRVVQILAFAPSADVVVLQRDLLFKVRVAWLEKLLFSVAPNARVIFDVDDAIFFGRDGSIAQGVSKKIEGILKRVNLVLVSNTYLKEKILEISPVSNIEIVPTVIDTNRFKVADQVSNNEVPVLCWSGVRANIHYLEQLLPVFIKLSEQCKFKLRIIVQADTPNNFLGHKFEVEMCAWDKESEVRDLRSADIGLMPLSDDAWSRGKAGFKLLQYMSCGLAAVASPVGVNSEIVDHNQNGLLASDAASWVEGLTRLINDASLRSKLGEGARAAVLQRYSLQAWQGRWMELLLGTKAE